MSIRTIKKIFLSGVFLTLGFAGGYSYMNVGKSDEYMEVPLEITTEKHTGRPLNWEKINKEKKDHKKTFTAKDLRELKGWLNKNPTSEQVSDKLYELMQYPFSKKEENLYLAFQHLFSYWGQKDPHKSLEKVMGLSPPWTIIKSDLVQTALASQIKNNPTEVANWFNNEKTGLFPYTEILPALSRSLTMQSPDEAWEWLSSLRYAEQNKCLQYFFESLYRLDPDRIEEFIQKLEPPEKWGTAVSLETDTPSKIDQIVHLYAKANYAAAMKWVESFPESLKDTAYLQLLKVKAEEDLSEATKMLSEMKENRGNALYALANTVFASGDQEKITTWLQELSKNAPKLHSSYYSFIQHINSEDLAGIINKLPSGKVKDSIIYNYIYMNLNSDFTTSEKILQQMEDQELKEIMTEFHEKNKVRKKDEYY